MKYTEEALSLFALMRHFIPRYKQSPTEQLDAVSQYAIIRLKELHPNHMGITDAQIIDWCDGYAFKGDRINAQAAKKSKLKSADSTLSEATSVTGVKA